MPRVRKTPINNLMGELMEQKGLKRLKDIAPAYPGFSEDSAYNYADILDGKHKPFESLLRDSRAANMTTGYFICRLLDKKYEPTDRELETLVLLTELYHERKRLPASLASRLEAFIADLPEWMKDANAEYCNQVESA